MNDLVPLHFDRADIRMIIRDGAPWWVLRDLCVVLKIKNHRDAATRLWGWQKDGVGISDAIGRQQKTIIVNEAGAYSLILDSKRPEAERFAHWLFTEVLPAIRKHGRYPPPPETEPETLERPVLVEPWLAGTEADRFFDECRRIFQTDDPKVLEIRLDKVISASRLRALKQGGGVETMLYNTRAWHTLASAGFDFRYILNENWIYTPDERGLIDNLRTLDDQAKAVAMHRIGGHIETLRIAGN